MNPTLRLALDTSALITMIQNAPGGSLVGARLRGSVVSTISWAELTEHMQEQGLEVAGFRRSVETLGLEIQPFTAADADRAVELWRPPPAHQLSLSDRACLALADRLKIPVLTADETWRDLELGIEIRMLR